MGISSFLPFLPDLRQYNRSLFRADVMGALAVVSMAIPQSMAYALIAGVHPQYGLYASMLPVIVAALWGSSRYLVAGPTNAIAMVLFSTITSVSVGGVMLSSLPEDVRMTYVFGLALLCGCIQLSMGLARLGDLANFISYSVMVAFATGAALLIAAGQLNNILGLTGPKPAGFFPQLLMVTHSLADINYWSLGVALLTIAVSVALRRASRRLPATFLALLIVGIIATLLQVHQHGVKLVGPIPRCIPPFSLPPAFDLTALGDLFMPALAVALMGTVESLTNGKQLAAIKGDHFDGSRELIGQGLGNIAAGLTSGIPGSGSFSRSVLLVTSGGKTCLGAAFTGLLALPLLFLLGPLLSWLPMPALGGVLILIAVQMISRENIRLCLVATRADRVVWLITFAATLILDLERAIFIGVILSLVLFIYKTAHPRVRRLKDDDPLMCYAPANLSHDIAIYTIEGTLFFGAIHELERQLAEFDRKPARLVVLHLARVFWLDASGAQALAQFVEHCYARSVPVMLVLDSPNVRQILKRTGLLDYLSNGFVTDNLPDGLRQATRLLHHIRCSTDPSMCAITPEPEPESTPDRDPAAISSADTIPSGRPVTGPEEHSQAGAAHEGSQEPTVRQQVIRQQAGQEHSAQEQAGRQKSRQQGAQEVQQGAAVQSAPAQPVPQASEAEQTASRHSPSEQQLRQAAPSPAGPAQKGQGPSELSPQEPVSHG